jgi:MFS family permease
LVRSHRDLEIAPTEQNMNRPSPLAWYFASLAFFTVPAGMHAVLFPWLVAVHLGESAARVGVAQMAGTLPALVLVLVGGLLADRVDQRRMLATLHCVAALPPLTLALLVGLDKISYVAAVGYALAFGSINALAQPVRDAMLSAVAGSAIQRAVTLTVGAQFAVQLVGFALASTTDAIGPAPLLVAQSCIVALGYFATRYLPRPPVHAHGGVGVFASIAEGWRLVWRSERMLPALLNVGGMGLFFGGAYSVLIPLYLRDVYGGEAAGLALAFASFMAGTMVSTFGLVFAGGVRRSGRWLLCASASGVVTMSVLLLPIPLWVFYLTILAWGVGGGIALSMSRSIVQESAPATHRARVMSVYHFGNLGSLPIGALIAGYAVEWLGATRAALVPCIGVVCIVILLVSTTRLWRIEALPAGALVKPTA